MLSKDVMTRNVITARPDATVQDIARVLIDKNISAVPIINDAGSMVGIVSEGDLMRRAETGSERHSSWWLALLGNPTDRAFDALKSHGRLAKHVMSSPVISVNEDTPVSEVARLLEERHVKRVPVLRDGELVGIVSRSNLLQGLVSAEFHSPVAHSDAELREAVLKELGDEVNINVTVIGGAAHLWGLVDSEAERKAAEAVTSATDGVTRVLNHLTVLPAHVTRGEFWW